MLAYLYLSRRTLTGEVFPASSSTGEAVTALASVQQRCPRPPYAAAAGERREGDSPYCWASARSPQRSQRG